MNGWRKRKSWERFNLYLYARPFIQCLYSIYARKICLRKQVKIMRRWKSILSCFSFRWLIIWCKNPFPLITNLLSRYTNGRLVFSNLFLITNIQLLNSNVLNNFHLVKTGVTPFVSCFLRNLKVTMNYGQIRSQIRDIQNLIHKWKLQRKRQKEN